MVLKNNSSKYEFLPKGNKNPGEPPKIFGGTTQQNFENPFKFTQSDDYFGLRYRSERDNSGSISEKSVTPWGGEFDNRTESGHFAFEDQFYYGSPQDNESPQDNDPKMQSQKKSNDSPCAKDFQGSLLLKRSSEIFPMEERIGETLRRSNNKFITVGTPTPSEQFIEVARGIHEDSSKEIENKHMSFKPSRNNSSMINSTFKELGQAPSKKNSPMTCRKFKQIGQDL
jgi:hypothetical protein